MPNPKVKLSYSRKVSERLNFGTEFKYSHPEKESALHLAYEYLITKARIQGLLDTEATRVGRLTVACGQSHRWSKPQVVKATGGQSHRWSKPQVVKATAGQKMLISPPMRDPFADSDQIFIDGFLRENFHFHSKLNLFLDF